MATIEILGPSLRLPLGADELHFHESSSKPLPAPEKGKESVNDRPHLQFVSRPPEWDAGHADDELSPSEFSNGSGDETEQSVEHPEHDEAVDLTHQTERGTSLSFPSLSLRGLELLELVSLNLTIKCDRCKQITEAKNLKPQRAEGYRKELMHANAVRAGFLDLDGCIVADMLPRQGPYRLGSCP
ncbi:MAG: hypothetical protein M1838_001697 [Thelocarpon superellum]|nr:MAG: hypothetical protein M1838_001697 [Thelocarpon superellum]